MTHSGISRHSHSSNSGRLGAGSVTRVVGGVGVVTRTGTGLNLEIIIFVNIFFFCVEEGSFGVFFVFFVFLFGGDDELEDEDLEEEEGVTEAKPDGEEELGEGLTSHDTTSEVTEVTSHETQGKVDGNSFSVSLIFVFGKGRNN